MTSSGSGGEYFKYSILYHKGNLVETMLSNGGIWGKCSSLFGAIIYAAGGFLKIS